MGVEQDKPVHDDVLQGSIEEAETVTGGRDAVEHVGGI